MKTNTFFGFVFVGIVSLALGVSALRIPGHNYISINPSEFGPRTEECFQINSIWELVGNTNCYPYMYAAIQVPDGVTISKVTFYWKDGASGPDGIVTLIRNNLDGTRTNLVDVFTNGDANIPSSSSISTSIVVDNSQYAYYLMKGFSDPTISLYGVVIEYTYPIYLPFITRIQ